MNGACLVHTKTIWNMHIYIYCYLEQIYASQSSYPEQCTVMLQRQTKYFSFCQLGVMKQQISAKMRDFCFTTTF